MEWAYGGPDGGVPPPMGPNEYGIQAHEEPLAQAQPPGEIPAAQQPALLPPAQAQAAPVGHYPYAPAYPPPGFAPVLYPHPYIPPYPPAYAAFGYPPLAGPPGAPPHIGGQHLAIPPPMGPAPHAAAGPYVAQGPANRPNPEPVPGVYEVLVTVLCTETVKRDFTIRTDCTWEWLCTSVKQRLDEEDGGSDEAPKFGYKISTADTRRAPYTALSSAADWKTAMSRVSGIAAKARTRTVGIEIVDLVRQEKQAAKKSKAKKKSPKKRKRTDADSTDDEDENIPENATQAFRELKEHLFCQLHAQHCYVSAAALSGGHAYVSNKNLMLWAKAMSRGEADKHNPPHYLEFERVPKTPRGQQGPYRHLPEIHVHIRQPKPRSTQRRSSAELTKPSRCSNTSGSPGTPSQASPAPSLGESPKPASSSTPSVLSTEASSCQVYPWIDYPDLEQLLSALDAQDPTSGFLHLRDQLTRAAFTNVEDITCISPAMLYLLVRPRIPPSQILALYSQAEVMIAETHQQRADEISQWEQLGLTNTTSKTVNNEYDAEVAEGLETEEESTVTDDYTTTTNGGSE